MKRRSLMRYSAAFFPLALIAGAVFGDKTLVCGLLAAYFAMQLASFCAVTAFCNAAAREPAKNRVGKRFWGAIVQLIIGMGVIFCAKYFYPEQHECLDSEILIAAVLIFFEQLFEERIFALSRKVDGTLITLIANGLMFLGIALDGGAFLGNATPLAHPYLLGGCASGAIMALLLLILLAEGRGFTLLPINYGFAPKAMVQELLYPAAMFALIFFAKFDIPLVPLIFGWMLWRLCRTVCRRARTESKPLDWLLTITALAALILAHFFPAVLPYALASFAVLVCAAAVYLAPSVRLYVSLAILLLMTLAALFYPVELLVGLR